MSMDKSLVEENYSASVKPEDIVIELATEAHAKFAAVIVETIYEAAKKRGTGIAKRTPEYIVQKINDGKAIIATHKDGSFAGFCYIETWQDKQYVANSGLIVAPKYRRMNLARRIKKAAFDLSRSMYPNSKIFGITTSAAVMKINSELGYLPVHFSELTTDEEFWSGCNSCPNIDILKRTNRAMCLCTGMLWSGEQQ
jgi:ribosomal protein L9